MSITDELRPCPFCGATASVYAWWSDKEECGIASVGCNIEYHDDGTVCPHIIVRRSDEQEARMAAIESWNRRANRRAK